MNEVSTIEGGCPRLLLLSDDTILGDFFRHTVGPGLAITVETASPRDGAQRLDRLGRDCAIATDQRAFDRIEADLGPDRPGGPLILVTGQLDRTTVRRLLAAGGSAIVPTSYERPQFLNGISFALAGDFFFPSSLWMPYLEETLTLGAGPAAETEGGQLTRREYDVLGELARGKTNKMIAFSLGISEPTVKMHLAHLGKKLGVGNRTQLLTRAIRQGLIPDLTFGADRAAPAGR